MHEEQTLAWSGMKNYQSKLSHEEQTAGASSLQAMIYSADTVWTDSRKLI